MNKEEYASSPDINFIDYPEINKYHAIVIAVAHQEFIDLGLNTIKEYGKKTHFVFDIKALFPHQNVDMRL